MMKCILSYDGITVCHMQINPLNDSINVDSTSRHLETNMLAMH